MDIHGESSSSSGFKLFGKTIVASEKVDGQDQDQDDSTIIVADHEETYSKSEEIASENIATTAAAAAASTKRGQLPCPRCKSKETKFCYFNNYNVNQPRHFCKACHRYWTAGGALRNVPVGAGRRKNRALPQGSGGGGDGDDEGGGGGMCLAAAGGDEVERWLTS